VRRSTIIAGLVAVVLAVLGAACSPPRPARVVARPVPLRVGITPDAAPYVFWDRDHYAGIEVELAHRLAEALGRPLALVPVAWDEQIPVLLAGHTDVIMSGMSITPKRASRVAFGDPYLETSLQGVVRREDARKYPTPDALLQTSPRIGVKKGTTGEAFVRQRRPDENIVVYRRSRDAINELRGYRIDVYVGDAPVIEAAIADHPGDLVAYPRAVGRQSLAWAFRPDEQDLRLDANAVLARWRVDGTLQDVLTNWPHPGD